MFFKRKGIKRGQQREVKDGVWLKCERCGEVLYKKELENNLWICSKCNYHFRIPANKYIEILLDEGKIEKFDNNITSTDPLSFPKYKEKLKKSQEKTGMKEGVLYGVAKIGRVEVVFAITDFSFMGGSMGSVVGEKIARSMRKANDLKVPLVILTASGGGARMQEGIISLMQMAKTSIEIALLNKNRVPYITILTHPTMAGVMASFAALGDISIAEPGALLGFTGPRVIEQTIKQKLPDGFQRSEFLLEHGLVDMVVNRKELKDTVSKILNLIGFKK